MDTVASTGDGLAELWGEISRHRAHLRASGVLEQRRADRMAHELRRVLLARSAVIVDELASGEEFASAVKALAAGELIKTAIGNATVASSNLVFMGTPCV